MFAVAAFTDGLDGYIARSRGSVTNFGKLMDPLADKLLIIAPLISLVSLDRIAPWVAMVIIARELAVTMLRMVAVERGVVIPASWLGKAKTILQVAAIFAVIAFETTPLAVDALLYAAVAVTVVSGADYFFGVRRQRMESGAKPTEPRWWSPGHEPVAAYARGTGRASSCRLERLRGRSYAPAALRWPSSRPRECTAMDRAHGPSAVRPASSSHRARLLAAAFP